MKNIKEYIIEGKKYFTLDNDERAALSEFIGYLTDNEEGTDNFYKNEIEPGIKLIQKELNDDDIKQLDSLYDCLKDDHTYPKINRNHIVDDIPLLKKIFDIIEKNDIRYNFDDEMCALEKICL